MANLEELDNPTEVKKLEKTYDFLAEMLQRQGIDITRILDGLILGSGLGSFAEDYLVPMGKNNKHIEIPFDVLLEQHGLPPHPGKVPGHQRKLIIGSLRGDISNRLVIAQSGREHPYEGISAQRATLWLRLMQRIGVETLIMSNAAGIITPDTLQSPGIMLVNSDINLDTYNPLEGINYDQFGPRFPHMGNVYSPEMREIAHQVAESIGLDLKEGTYIRVSGPNYESPEAVYRARALLHGIFSEGRKQKGENRFHIPTKEVWQNPSLSNVAKLVLKSLGLDYRFARGVIGMSSTYEMLVAQQATQSTTWPAFQKGKAAISVASNYAAGLSVQGPGTFPSHPEVQENAKLLEEQFGRLVQGMIMKNRKRITADQYSLAT